MTWPELPYEEWKDTCTTLHLWTQIVGKVRLAISPWINHSWHATFYVTSRGLTTSLMHQGPRSLELEFDLVNHRLEIEADGSMQRTMALEPRTVASFYLELMRHLSELGFDISIHQSPNEVEETIPFAEDTVHASYDGEYANRFWQVLSDTHRVFTGFRAGFLGKVSPVHLFWGSFDLALTRFSGRSAPPHPGGFPNLPDWITREAYSHEVASAGFWPGGPSSPAPAFYAYSYPVPEGLGAEPVEPAGAFYSEEMREYFLPYDAMRETPEPDKTLMRFLESTYETIARTANWDRESLETPTGFPRPDPSTSRPLD